MRYGKLALLAAVVVLIAGVANAQDDMKGWYVGVGAGSAAIEYKADTALSTDIDEDTTQVRLFGGYRAGKHFQFELGVADMGEVTAVTVSDDDYEAALSGIDLNLFGILPLANNVVDLYVKVGIVETEIRETVIDDAGMDPPTQNDWTSVDYLVGAGVQVNLLKDRSLGLRLDYSVHDTKTRVESWDTFSLSVLYRF